MQKIVRFFLIFFVALVCLGSENLKSNNSLLPVLPQDPISLGGRISFLGHNTNLIGLLYNEKLEEVMFNDLADGVVLKDGPGFVSIKKISQLAMTGNYLNKEYSILSKKSLDGAVPPFLLLSPNAQYVPNAGVVVEPAQTDNKQSLSETRIYDSENGALLYTIEGPASIDGIAKHLVVINSQSSFLVNLDTGEIYINDIDVGSYNFDSELFVTKKRIFSLKEKKTVSDLSSFGFVTRPRIDDDTIIFVTYNEASFAYKYTRLTRLGELVEQRNVVLPNDASASKVYQLGSIYKNFAIGLSVGPKKDFYKIFDLYTGFVYLERSPDRDSESYCFFSGAKCVFGTKEGAEVIDLSTMKVIKNIVFPEKPIILSDDERIFVITPSSGPLSKSMTGVFLDEQRRPVLHTITSLPSTAGTFRLWKNNVLSFTITKRFEKSVLHNDIDIGWHGIGSSAPFKTVNISFQSESWSYVFKDGMLFLGLSAGAISVVSCEDGRIVYVIPLISGCPQLQKDGPSTITVNDGTILFQAMCGDINTFLCYQEYTKARLAKLDYPATRKTVPIAVNKNYLAVIHKNTLDFPMQSGIEVHYFENDETHKINGFYICFNDEKIYYYKYIREGDKENRYLCSFDLRTKEETESIIEKTVKGPASIVHEAIGTSDGDLFNLNGEWMQRDVGEPIPVFENGEKSVFTNLDQIGLCSTLFSLDPCPTFYIKMSENTKNKTLFEISNTREDGLGDVFKGDVYVVTLGEGDRLPLFSRLANPVKIGPLLSGMSQKIWVDVPGNLENFGLVFISNGLLDTQKSMFSVIDKGPRPMYEGTPITLNGPKSVVLTLWKRQ